MLNAPRPRRPSLSTTQPAVSEIGAPSSTSFRYSTSRPRFSTNPSRRLSNGFENDDMRTGSASGPSSSTHGSGSTWTEGQYPGPPLPARNPPLSNGASAASANNQPPHRAKAIPPSQRLGRLLRPAVWEARRDHRDQQTVL